MLVINDPEFAERAEVIWEKGTNRSAFFRGEVDKYGWVDIGSSFLPSDIIAAFLWAQLENLTDIQAKRLFTWNMYFEGLKSWAETNNVKLPSIPSFATNNAHMFYLVFNSMEQRQAVIDKLRSIEVTSVFHYISLHSSKFYKASHDGRDLPGSDRYSDTLLRLPMYFDLEEAEVAKIIDAITHTNFHA